MRQFFSLAFKNLCVCVCASISRQKSFSLLEVALFSPQTTWCNKILICRWITLVLFCPEMHSEWLVYSTHNPLDKLQHCFASEVEWEWLFVCVYECVFMHVFAQLEFRGKDILTPLVGPCALWCRMAHMYLSPLQIVGLQHLTCQWLMFPLCAFPISNAPTVVRLPYKNLVITGLIWDCAGVIQNLKLDFCCLHMTAPDYEATVSIPSWRQLLFCLELKSCSIF